MSILPNAIGRIDAITEAIRDGDRERAAELMRAERDRLQQSHTAACSEQNRIYKSWLEVSRMIEKFYFGDSKYEWDQARKACGWSGVDGFDGPVETLPPVKPKLRAEDLPLASCMVLGESKWSLYENDGLCLSFELANKPARFSCIGFSISEIQELIDRGVRFELPKEGEK